MGIPDFEGYTSDSAVMNLPIDPTTFLGNNIKISTNAEGVNVIYDYPVPTGDISPLKGAAWAYFTSPSYGIVVKGQTIGRVNCSGRNTLTIDGGYKCVADTNVEYTFQKDGVVLTT